MANRIAHDGKTKVCARCGPPAKSLSEFNKRSGRSGGYQSKCRQCQKKLFAAYYVANRDREIRRTASYLGAHPEVKSAGDRRYRLSHPEVFRRSAAKFRQTDHGKAMHRLTESARRARKLHQFIEDVDPRVVYRMYGGMCGICGEFIDGDFHVDHRVPLALGGMHGYINVQPAHPRCNLSKGWSS